MCTLACALALCTLCWHCSQTLCRMIWPAAGGHADIGCCVTAQVTCVYLFHELPAAVRRKAAAEMARVCKPGGMVVSIAMNSRQHCCAC